MTEKVHLERIRLLNETISDLRKRIKELEYDNSILHGSVPELDELKTTNKEQEKKIKQQQDQIEALGNQLENRTNERNELDERLPALAGEADHLRIENKNLKEEITAHKQDEKINRMAKAQNYFLKKCIAVEVDESD